MALLESHMQEQVENLREKSDDEFSNENYRQSLDLLLETWNILPEPKYVYDDSFYIAKDVIIISIVIKDSEIGKKWAEIIFKCDPERIDDGERDMLAGRVYYESEDKKTAIKYFIEAYKKSEGRLFENKKYSKYYELIKKMIR